MRHEVLRNDASSIAETTGREQRQVTIDRAIIRVAQFVGCAENRLPMQRKPSLFDAPVWI